MSALARYFKRTGKQVKGYDRNTNRITETLSKEGIAVEFSPEIDVSAYDIMVYTPAIQSDHQLMVQARMLGKPLFKRSEVLGWILEQFTTIAVAGTHGKTTTSAMIAHVFHRSIHDITAFVGGVMTEYNTNFLFAPESELAIAEADEFDRSFLTLKPQMAVVTSIDADHLDVYGAPQQLTKTFGEFIGGIQRQGVLFKKYGLELENPNHVTVFTYGVNQPNADFYANNLRTEEGIQYFDLHHPVGVIEDLELKVPGYHNVENAVAAAGIALNYNIDPLELKAYFATFKGVKRRFEYIIKTDERVFIDDYAHHPQELQATIKSVRTLFPEKRITGVFQPHLYSRTRDFLEAFAQSLSLLDELLLMEIYPAREMPIEGVSSSHLLGLVDLPKKELVQRDALVDRVKAIAPEVLLTLGAGDIDKEVEPIKRALLS